MDQDREAKHKEFMDTFESKLNIKKSFELKLVNDDDDDIFIVHEEPEFDQDNEFV